MTTSTLLISKGFPLPPPYNPTVPNVPNTYPEVRSETVVGPKGDYGTYVVLQNISPQSVDAITPTDTTRAVRVYWGAASALLLAVMGGNPIRTFYYL
jgi:hypothetical protein